MELIVLFLIIALCALALPFQRKSAKNIYNYRAKSKIMTSAEMRFHTKLLEVFTDNRYYVYPQVHLATFLEHKIKGQNWKGAFLHINGKSIDFLIVRKDNLSVVCAIELDDYTHDRVDRIERDKEIERIFEQAKIPLIRFRDSRISSEDLIKQIKIKISHS